MGGDQGNGLAMAIGIVMILMVLGAVAAFFLIGRAIARRVAPRRRGPVIAATMVLGVVAGWMAVTATFYESTWSPPPSLRLVTAPGFSQPRVILLEDPRSTQSLAVRESRLPFMATVAEVDVPASGIVRVRDLSAVAGRMDLGVQWSDGMQGFGAGGGPAPPGTGARSYLLIPHPNAATPPGDLVQAGEPAAFAAYVAEKEARR